MLSPPDIPILLYVVRDDTDAAIILVGVARGTRCQTGRSAAAPGSIYATGGICTKPAMCSPARVLAPNSEGNGGIRVCTFLLVYLLFTVRQMVLEPFHTRNSQCGLGLLVGFLASHFLHDRLPAMVPEVAAR